MADTSGIQPLHVSLLEGFAVRSKGQEIDLPPAAQRLVALLSLRRGLHTRCAIAGRLWLDATEVGAAANLRTALWRTRRACSGLLFATRTGVRLSDSVRLDVEDVEHVARLVEGGELPNDPAETIALLRRDLLPDWYDDWVFPHRERLRHQRLHALEQLSCRLCAKGRYSYAVQAAQAAVSLEPLRETAQMVLVGVHAAERNLSEAHRQLQLYRKLLWEELGIDSMVELSDCQEALRTMVRLSEATTPMFSPATR